MIAIVTGAGGFIGSHLVRALLARGATVRVLARADVVAIRPDAPVWSGATHLFHVGGATKARTDAEFRAANVRPTVALLAAAAERGVHAAHATRAEGAEGVEGAERATPPRIILISSQAAAGPAAHTPVTETDTPRPIEAYGRSKLEAEREAARYADRVPIVVVRPAAVYGPRDRDFLRAFQQAASRVALYAPPRDQLFSIVHVRDLVDGVLRAAEHPAAAGRTYFIANDAPTTWRALYATVAEAAGTRPVELQLPALVLRAAALAGDLAGAVTGKATLLNRHKAAMAAPHAWTCDAARARHELGWQPQVELQSGLRETYLWYVRAGWVRGARPSVGERSIEEPEA